MGMGLVWKHALKRFLLPLYIFLEQNKSIRAFATKYIYQKPEHADFFVMSCLTCLNTLISVGVMFYWQLRYGHLPLWLVYLYYCSWVGVGGRIMGAAYALAHKEV
jgi:hypothetical protein